MKRKTKQRLNIALIVTAGIAIIGCSDPNSSTGDPITSYGVLDKAIENAQDAKSGVGTCMDGSSYPPSMQWVTDEVMDAFEGAIIEAQTARKNATTQTQVNNAADALNTATGIFNEAKANGTNDDPCECEDDCGIAGCPCGCYTNESDPCEDGHEWEGNCTTGCKNCDSIHTQHNYSSTGELCELCGYENPDFNPDCTHLNKSWDIYTEATCIEDETEIETCDDCHLKTDERTIPDSKLGHDYEFTEIVNPTCFEAGYDIFTCNRCPDTEQRNPVDTSGHTVIVWKYNVTQHWKECERFDQNGCDEKTTAANHDLSGWATENGGHTRSCNDDCGVTPQSHTINWGTWTSKNATHHHRECQHTDCDLKDEADHTGGIATCTVLKVCTACYQSYGELDQNNHTPIPDTVKSKDATCEEEGWKDATICKDCETELDTGEVTDALRHDHTESLVCIRTGCDHQYAIGNRGPGGGRIFYIADGNDGRPLGFDVAGYGANNSVEGYFTGYKAHYLEVAPGSVADGLVSWRGSATANVLIPEDTGITTFTTTEDVLANSIGNGRRDTQIIIAFYADSVANGSHETLAVNDTAANRATEYRAPTPNDTINDWFLPSSGEWNLLFQRGSLVGQTTWFWSSSQHSMDLVWDQGIVNNGGREPYNKSHRSSVRAIRAF